MNSNTGYQETQALSHSKGRVLAGLLILVAGILLLAREAGFALPWWLFTWPMLLTAIGLYIGLRHSFRGWAWIIVTGLGVVFLADDFFDNYRLRNFIWPGLVILVGLLMIFRSRNSMTNNSKNSGNSNINFTSHGDSYIEDFSMFGGVKKNIVTNDFAGGEVVTILGGSELNFLKADIKGAKILELTQIFGGTKLIIPAEWIIHTDEMVAIFGGIDDKRSLTKDINATNDKILKLKGTCIFGGIDIISY